MYMSFMVESVGRHTPQLWLESPLLLSPCGSRVAHINTLPIGLPCSNWTVRSRLWSITCLDAVYPHYIGGWPRFPSSSYPEVTILMEAFVTNEIALFVRNSFICTHPCRDA